VKQSVSEETVGTNKTTLVLGDWSDDGHGKTDRISITSNLDTKQIEKAYNKGAKKLGFNFVNDVANDYEDSLLPLPHLKTLIEHGLDIEQAFDEYELKFVKQALARETPVEEAEEEVVDEEEGDEDLLEDHEEGVHLWVDSFSYIYLFIVGLGDPKFVYKIVENGNEINIGGYGLFE
jgi:hypothetical protein